MKPPENSKVTQFLKLFKIKYDLSIKNNLLLITV